MAKLITLESDGTKSTIDSASLGGSGSFVINEVEIDFGLSPTMGKRFTITNALISPTTKIMVTPSGNPGTGRGSDDWEWDSITFAAKANTGTFTVYASSRTMIKGTRKIYYTIN